MAGNAFYGNGLRAAGRIASATGAKLLAPYPITRLERGAGLPRVDRVQYVLEPALEQFKEFRQADFDGHPSAGRLLCLSRKEQRFHSAGLRDFYLGEGRQKIMLARSTRWRMLCRCAAKINAEKADSPTVAEWRDHLAGLAAAVGALFPRTPSWSTSR